MSLRVLRAAIVAGLAEELDALVKGVEAHGGRFDVEELKRFSVKSPVVLVAVLGPSQVTVEGGAVFAMGRFAAYIVATDQKPQRSRDDVALDLAGQVAREIALQRWGGDTAGPPQQVAIDNMYSPAVDRLGVAMQAVTWRQKVELVPVTEAELDDWNSFNARIDMAPADEQIDAEDTAEMEQD